MIRIILAISITVVFLGCSAKPSLERGEVLRVNPKGLHDIGMGFGAEDLHITVEGMVSSMLKDEMFDGTPVIDVQKIENRTDEHIDTKAITDSIKTMIIKSKRARFVDSSIRAKIIDELEYQNSSRYTDKKLSKKIGKHIAQGYILNGSIVSNKQRNSEQTSKFYKITLQLHNIETASIDWIDEQEIKKIYNRPLIGW